MSDVELSTQALVTLPEARRYIWRNEDDSSRDGLLVDAINDISEAITEYCEREFIDTTDPDRSGVDGVTNGTTTFVSASGAFVAGDVDALLNIETKGSYRIVTVTNATTVELDGSPSAGTGLAWDFGEARVFDVGAAGRVNFAPFELRAIADVILYSDLEAASQQLLTSEEYRLRPTGGTSSGTYIYMHTIAPTLAALEDQLGLQVSVRGQWGMSAVPGGVKLACLQWADNIVKNPGGFATSAMSAVAVIPDMDTAVVAPAGMPIAVRYRLERWRRGVWLR